MTESREKEIRALLGDVNATISLVAYKAMTDLLEALDEARAERDKYKRTAEVNATCLAGAMRGMGLYSPPPAPLRWTSEPPTSPGWYWIRWGAAANHTEVVLVTDSDALRVHYGSRVADMRDVEWAGPIPAPASPAAQEKP